MKSLRMLGIALIVLGVLAFAYQGFTYTTRDKIVDIGPIQMTVEKTKTFPLPPIVGGVALAGGILLVIIGMRAKKSSV